MVTNVALSASLISKTFELDSGKKTTVLKDVSFNAHYGEFISILGISGSGKSTLLNCLSSLSKPTSGKVQIDGIDPYSLKNGALAKFRRDDISLIFQSYNLLPALPVYENIVLPLRLSHKKISQKKVVDLLQEMNFAADLNASVGSLSGGEQQKVAIARTILADSQIIFADEPTGALDSVSREKIFTLLRGLVRQGKCVIMVTHDIELASRTDRALILKDGRISEDIQNPSASVLYQLLEVAPKEL